MNTLAFPAYGGITNRINVSKPQLFHTDGAPRRITNMVMSDSSLRTSVRSQRGKLFEMTFSMYCHDTHVTAPNYEDTLNFFIAYNGDYIKYTDENSDEWIMQLLDDDIEIQDVSRGVWQFTLSGLRFAA